MGRRGDFVTERLHTLVQQFDRRRVLVVGDMVADEYIVGRPMRISREAPVLILHFADSFIRPGGATNTAYNLASLGAPTQLVGVVGDDDVGRRLLDVLKAAGIGTRGLIVDPHRPTSTKTRIVGKGVQEVQQQIVRIDRVDDTVIDGPLRDRMIYAVMQGLAEADAVIVSDYENGVISAEVIDACLPEARRRNLTITVDSHGDLFRFKGVTAATPNQPEAELTLHRTIRSDADLDDAGSELLAGMEAEGVLITRGSEGIALFEKGRNSYRLPISVTDYSEVVDPTGAGDTVAAVFTLAVTVGATMREASYLANLAGGVVVRRSGAVTLRRADLLAAVRNSSLAPPVNGD